MPPTTANNADSDEENDDENLDHDDEPEEVAGEIEVHEQDDAESDSEDIDLGASKRWRKNENLSLGSTSPLPSQDDLFQHSGKDIFDIFFNVFYS